MHAGMRSKVIPSLGLTVVLLLLVFVAASANSEYSLVAQEFASAPKSTLWEFERECEHPDQYTVGTTISRSNASGQEVHGQFGTDPDSGYSAQSGYVKYAGIDMPRLDDLYLAVQYSKHSPSSVPIEVRINDEPRATFTPTDMESWNAFTSTNEIHLGSVDSGTYTVTFYTEGQTYGVADLDKFILTGDPSPPEFLVFLPLVLKELASWAENNSYSTTCAEEDNINVPIFARRLDRFGVVATHPTYDVGVDNCEADFSGCTTMAFETADICTPLFDDGTNIVHGCTVTGWWRPYSMNIVVVGGSSGSYHYLTLYRKIQGEDLWPQFLVLYEDGNMRLKPHPPAGRLDSCYGSSVIVGPATPSSRPYVDIQEVQVNLPELSLDLAYRDGGTAHIDLAVDRSQAVALVEVDHLIGTEVPFATFRSMHVSDGNADVDHIQASAGDFPVLAGWTALEGPWWFFYRAVRSTHNTSAPDIRIEILEWTDNGG